MNKKKIFLILLILIIIGLIIYFITNNISITKSQNDEYSDYTPQEEISDKQVNQTIVNLYFINKETNKLQSEGQLVNANELLKNPYKLIINKLLNGPSDKSLKSIFPENTRLIDANLNDNCVIINFSEELLNFKNDTERFNMINCLLNSLTQLNEVTSIKILVNNEIRDGIDQEYSTISENT